MKTHFDVCIIGGGTAGMAAFYALRDKPYRIAIVEKAKSLGGTATNAWVENWIEGVNLPYFVELFNRLKGQGKSFGCLNNSILPARFSLSKTSEQLWLEGDALAALYAQDVISSKNTTLYSQSEFISAEVLDGRVLSINMTNVRQEIIQIDANYFIDASADGVLCRYNATLNIDYFIGEDPYDRFKENLMLDNHLNPIEANEEHLNEPSLFFKIKKDLDDSYLLSSIETVKPQNDLQQETSKPSYITGDGYPGDFWVNPMMGLGMKGCDVVKFGADALYTKAAERYQYEYWKYVKLELQRESLKPDHKVWIPAGTNRPYWNGWPLDYSNYGHTNKFASFLGIRETYRINCQRMLVQEDLVETVSSKKMGSFIACGSHEIDFHVFGNISKTAVNQFNNSKLRPSGIPYECLLPKHLKNVLIACRAFGASHIALAARRVNKDMAQLGWAAGKAISLCIEENRSNLILDAITLKKLQSDEYTTFETIVKKLEDLIAPQYK